VININQKFRNRERIFVNILANYEKKPIFQRKIPVLSIFSSLKALNKLEKSFFALLKQEGF